MMYIMAQWMREQAKPVDMIVYNVPPLHVP